VICQLLWLWKGNWGLFYFILCCGLLKWQLILNDRETVSALQKQVTQNQAEALEASTAALKREEDLKVRWAHDVSTGVNSSLRYLSYPPFVTFKFERDDCVGITTKKHDEH
jgi:hypothetical protein